MKRVGTLASVMCGALLAMSPKAEASSFTYNFCPVSASCHPDLTEASITFATVDGTPDVNDYLATVRFVGTLTTVFIDSIDFTSGIEFASLPALVTPPDGTVLGDWSTQFDKINNGAANCVGGSSNHMFACSKSTTCNGPDFAGTNTWVYSVDLVGNTLVGPTSAVNLRAIFVDANGDKVGAIFSPMGNFVTTATPTTGDTPTTGRVPEPAALSLLGVGLALAARRLRR